MFKIHYIIFYTFIKYIFKILKQVSLFYTYILRISHRANHINVMDYFTVF